MAEQSATMPLCRSLREYIVELIARLDEADPDAVDRVRMVVGERRARIVLDEEAVEAWFQGGSLVVVEADAWVGAVDGTGRTDRAATLDLLDGYLEVFEAVLGGRLDAVADIDDASRMFAAIDIVLDAATRTAALQRLAADYRSDPCRTPRPPHDPSNGLAGHSGGMYPTDVGDEEFALLERLDLLPATSS
jgi:hypothetical protein